MKQLILIFCCMMASLCAGAAGDGDGTIESRDITITPAGNDLVVSMNFVLDQLTLGRNHQVFVTPFIENREGSKSIMLPTYVFSGRNMHYVYLRSGETMATGKTRYDIAREMYAPKGQKEIVSYTERVALEPWMLREDALLRVSFDTCGCGRSVGVSSQSQPLALNPAERMLVVPFPTPDASVRKPISHHGEARVQFEVNKTELHSEPYVCRNGQRINNRAQLQVIDDSIRYALRDPNVEIESMSICGYASPESPYVHNDYLATNRSRALSEYIAKKYAIPQGRSHYSAVPENWSEFESIVRSASDITEQQRTDLLDLIAKPCYGPSDYDAKEAMLKNDSRFAQLYKTKILPEWFPRLRCTRFEIRTQLKPMTPVQLRDVMAKTPELMSLDEIYLVANSYEHGSEEFLNAMKVALEQYPDDHVANGNAAAVAIEHKDFATAEAHIAKAPDTAETWVMKGIIATWKGDFASARQWFEQAGNTPEAKRNLQLINQ